MLALLLLPLSLAASLDNLEIGGPWGSPAATDATSIWWNPAAVAAGQGTRVQLEGAPTFGGITFDRAEPHGGADVYRYSGVVPYAGLASDFGVPGLGLGVGMAVPYARGAAEVDEPGSGRYAFRQGEIRAVSFLGVASYEILDRVAIGVQGQLVESQWSAVVDTETMPDLAAAILEQDPSQQITYTDDDLEDPRYASTLTFPGLRDQAWTLGAGLHVKATPTLTFGVAWQKGYRVDNTGDVDLAFSCPPDTDTTGRFASESTGLCNANLKADATVGYDLPSRVHGAIRFAPNSTPEQVEARREPLVLTAMGGWVGWSAYKDFDITVEGVEERSQVDDPRAAALINQTRQWARDNQDTLWGGIDAKARFAEKWEAGGRVLVDQAAVPDAALSPNNYDALDVAITGMGSFTPIPALQIGAWVTHHAIAERTVTDSGFSMTMDAAQTPEDRWNYPHTNGTYSGGIDRVGLAVKSQF